MYKTITQFYFSITALQVTFSVVRTTNEVSDEFYVVLGWDMFSVNVQSDIDLITSKVRTTKDGNYVHHINAASYERNTLGVSLSISYKCRATNEVSFTTTGTNRPETNGRAFMSFLTVDRLANI